MDAPRPEWETVIGLEVHVQIATASKMYCACPAENTQELTGANRNVCPVCLGHPGTLPRPNRQAVVRALTLAQKVGASMRERSVFARKNYFYPDLPKGYQISQYDLPLASGGAVEYWHNGEAKQARLVRMHLEEDTAKLFHGEGQTSPRQAVGQVSVPVQDSVLASGILQATPEDFRSYVRHLPHWRLSGSIYFLTWRVNANQPDLPDAARDIVVSALKHFDGERYHLVGFVVMSDHVHVVVKPLAGHELSQITYTWKSFTANRIQREVGWHGAVWQDETWDRIVRDEDELFEKLQYMQNNPVKRWGLHDYQWLSLTPLAADESWTGTETCPTSSDATPSQASGKRAILDFNRSGIPLLEIVTEPDFRSGAECISYLDELRTLLQRLGVSEAAMEEGNFRCEPNVSVRLKGEAGLRTKTELKNLNSFATLRRAVEAEVARQVEMYDKGEPVVQSTLRYDQQLGVTVPMRLKETADDYRYFDDPDIPPLVLSQSMHDEARLLQADSAFEQRRRMVEEHGLGHEQAATIADDAELQRFYELCVADGHNPREVAKWVTGDLLRLMRDAPLSVEPGELSYTLRQLDEKKLTLMQAREVFEAAYRDGRTVASVVEARAYGGPHTADELRAECMEVIAGNPKVVEDIRGGKLSALQVLVGQVMKRTRGGVKAEDARQMLSELLGIAV